MSLSVYIYIYIFFLRCISVSFSLDQCSQCGNVHRRNLAASCFAIKSKSALQQRQCDASQS